MALTTSQRTVLSASIKSAISNIPNLLDKWSQSSSIRKYQIESINEFVYGYVIGLVSNSFHNIIFISEGRIATPDEIQEAEEMTSRQLHDIRDLIMRERYYHRLRQ
jgi:hypothetical protein